MNRSSASFCPQRGHYRHGVQLHQLHNAGIALAALSQHGVSRTPSGYPTAFFSSCAESIWLYRGPRRLIILRVENGFLLQIGLEAANRSEEFRFMNPSSKFDDEFLKAYDADSRILNVSSAI